MSKNSWHRKPAAPKNRGAQLLIAKAIRVSSLARESGLSQRSIRAWLDSKNVPSPTARSQLERALGVPVGAWDEPPQADPPPRVKAPAPPPKPAATAETQAPPPTKAPSGDDLKRRAEYVQDLIRRNLQNDPGSAEWARLEIQAIKAENQLRETAAKLKDLRIHHDPDWPRLRDGIAEIFVACDTCAARFEEFRAKNPDL